MWWGGGLVGLLQDSQWQRVYGSTQNALHRLCIYTSKLKSKLPRESWKLDLTYSCTQSWTCPNSGFSEPSHYLLKKYCMENTLIQGNWNPRSKILKSLAIWCILALRVEYVLIQGYWNPHTYILRRNIEWKNFFSQGYWNPHTHADPRLATSEFPHPHLSEARNIVRISMILPFMQTSCRGIL